MLSAFHEMNLLSQNILRFFFQPAAESFDLIPAQSNVNLGDFRTGRELAQSVNEDRRTAKLSELLARRGLLAPGARSRGHARPQPRSRNDCNHLHNGL